MKSKMVQEKGLLRFNHRRLIGIAAIAVLVVLPFINPPYLNLQFSLVLVYAVAVTGLNLFTGVAGQISLAQGAFFAVGAYTSGIMLQRWDLSLAWSIVPAGALAFILGLIIGVPATRLAGHYLALMTLALAVVTAPLLKHFGTYTGGVSGLSLKQPESPIGGVANDQWIYLLSLALALVIFFAAANLSRGRIGRALFALKDNRLAASGLGVNVARFKIIALGFSAGCAGVAGSMYAFAVGYIAPDSFDVLLTVGFLAAVVIGGAGRIFGPIFGSLFIVFVPNYASAVNPGLAGLAYGIAIVVFMVALPDGLVGLLRRLRRLIPRAQGEAATERHLEGRWVSLQGEDLGESPTDGQNGASETMVQTQRGTRNE